MLEWLKKIWAILDFICGKRLAGILPEVVPLLEQHHEIALDAATRQKLCSISPATIDRSLAAERRRFAVRGRCGTKPGTLLKHQIPIRTFAEWNQARPGFVEIDLVSLQTIFRFLRAIARNTAHGERVAESLHCLEPCRAPRFSPPIPGGF